jgi:hypothetical protein
MDKGTMEAVSKYFWEMGPKQVNKLVDDDEDNNETVASGN